jgi:hypothetical protein
MAELAIPKQYRLGFEKLSALSKVALATLLEVLRKEKPALVRAELAEHVATKIPDVKEEDVIQILDALIGLYWGRQSMGLSINEFADLLASQAFDANDPKRANFKKYLGDLLAVEPLVVTSKALDILTEHEHTVHDLRIITDLRPIFKEDPPQKPVNLPAAAVITHTLKISYRRGTQVDEFFLALDDNDIALLKTLIKRAEAKKASLKKVLTATRIPCIETKTH